MMTPNNTQHTPNEIKRMALKQLRETRSAMMESEYLLALKENYVIFTIV
ncbi:MAG: hypothetical protein ACYS76_14635 [Planctomycetota bacterium]|jgi:hypothetical protein